MNANITKMQIFDDLVITLTYVLMDNFCPCFIKKVMVSCTKKFRIKTRHISVSVNIPALKVETIRSNMKCQNLFMIKLFKYIVAGDFFPIVTHNLLIMIKD